MRLAAVLTLLLALCAVLAGCSSGEDEAETPVACLGDAGAYLRALEVAPAEVRLDGTTPISDCLTPGQPPADLANVGESLVGAATQLNAEARRNPRSPAALQLGYLFGAVERGAAETAGIHTDLVRRIESGARFTGGGRPPREFQRGFAQGFAAGRAGG